MLGAHREEKQAGSISEKYVQRFDTVRGSVTDNQEMAGLEILHHQQLHCLPPPWELAKGVGGISPAWAQAVTLG